jgi:two-component system, response regulator FlrC
VIATSNRDLAEEVRLGRFRSDLYYRLNVMSLQLPALARRRGDILPLAERALRACGRGALRFSGDARAALLQHDWPGNVRELSNTVQRAALLCSGAEVDAAALGLDSVVAAAGAALAPAAGAMAAGLGSMLDGRDGLAAGTPAPDARLPGLPGGCALDDDLKARERQLIFDTLRATHGSRKLAAERLGISARTLRHKLQQIRAAGLPVPQGRGELAGGLT